MGDWAQRRALLDLCCSLAVAAHSSPAPAPFLLHSIPRPHDAAVFAFPASWSAAGWIRAAPFGDEAVDEEVFPSLRRVGSGEVARVNSAFSATFQNILSTSNLKSEVHKAVEEKKHVIFTGHSSGGPIAVLTAIWFLENCVKPTSSDNLYCVTFGSPLVGDAVFSHAVQRENWAPFFLHFINTFDVAPRIPLAPMSPDELQGMLRLLSNCRITGPCQELLSNGSDLASTFYVTVLRNCLSISSYQACLFMGNTSSVLGTLTSFIQLSPYRPCGKYVFICTSNGPQVSTTNPDAVLQLLFYFLQLDPQHCLSEASQRSLNEHWHYESTVKQLMAQTAEFTTSTFAHLDLSREASLSLRAAEQWEHQRKKNQATIDANGIKIQEALRFLNEYRTTCELRGSSYYDAFKIQRNVEDFNANVRRQELAGLWDEIVEMLCRHELPDCFEGRVPWVELGTHYRRLVEPLDIANYYRHSKNEDTGSYITKGRPRRYKYTQNWHEHALRAAEGSCYESCFWALVEELQATDITDNDDEFEQYLERVSTLESDLIGWVRSGSISTDVFLAGSSFVIWWKKTMPQQHKEKSCIMKLVHGEDFIDSGPSPMTL